jgi:nucleoside-specific outer membrane channel protein Tsx
LAKPDYSSPISRFCNGHVKAYGQFDFEAGGDSGADLMGTRYNNAISHKAATIQEL